MRASGIYLIGYGVFSALAFSSVSINAQDSLVVVLGAVFGTLLIYSGYMLLSGRHSGFTIGTFTCATLSGFYTYLIVFSADWLSLASRLADTLMLVGGIFGLALCLTARKRSYRSIQSNSGDGPL